MSNYFRILSPQISKFIIDAVAKQIQHSSNVIETIKYNIVVKYIIELTKNLTTTQLTIVCGFILFALAILGGLFMFLMRQTIIVMSRHIEFDQKNEMFNHYQKLDIEFYKTHSTGDLMNRISDDVSKVRMYTGPAIMYIINLVGTIGFSLYFMFKENALLSFYVIAPLPLLVVIIYYVNNIINTKSEQQQSSLSNLTTISQESYSGIRVIKSFVQETVTQQFFKEKSNDYKKNAIGLAKVEALYFPSIALLIGLSTIIAICAGTIMHIKNPAQVTAGTIAEFVIYVNMLTFPVSAIGLTASMIQRAAASQKRLNEFLETQPSVENGKWEITNSENNKQHTTLNTQQKNYILKNVSFVYKHSGIKALNNISFCINQNEKIFILGNTGSGKTTLALLLLRMYDCTAGNIFINNENINEIDLQNLRKNISYVPQDVFLFSDTIKNNIAFGSAVNIDVEQVKEAAKKASIHNEIEALENGYETLVGERGITLSGGQKQRISMARAFLKQASLYIFDDCFSAIDNITEQKVGTSLTTLLHNKSAIFISHRIFKELVFDKIIVLENGFIIEQGTQTELIQLNGYYAKTFKKQMAQ